MSVTENTPKKEKDEAARLEAEAKAERAAQAKADTRDEVFTTMGQRTRLDAGPLPIGVSAEAEEVKGNAGQNILDAQERGFHGFVADPTPNHHYTFAGAAAGLPTPETDGRLNAVAAQRVTLPGDVPFVPVNQEQFEQLMAHKAEQTGSETAPHGE